MRGLENWRLFPCPGDLQADTFALCMNRVSHGMACLTNPLLVQNEELLGLVFYSIRV